MQRYIMFVIYKLGAFLSTGQVSLMGADHWKRMDSKWDHYKTNGDAMIGRLHYLSPEWQLITATSPTELPDALRQP